MTRWLHYQAGGHVIITAYLYFRKKYDEVYSSLKIVLDNKRFIWRFAFVTTLKHTIAAVMKLLFPTNVMTMFRFQHQPNIYGLLNTKWILLKVKMIELEPNTVRRKMKEWLYMRSNLNSMNKNRGFLTHSTLTHIATRKNQNYLTGSRSCITALFLAALPTWWLYFNGKSERFRGEVILLFSEDTLERSREMTHGKIH